MFRTLFEKACLERRRAILAALWGSGVLAVFVVSTRSVAAPLADLVLKLGLCLSCTYALLLCGFGVHRRMGPHLEEVSEPAESFALELALGALIVALSMMALGVAGLFKPWAAWGLLGVAMLGPHRDFLRTTARRVRTLAAEKSSWVLALGMVTAAGMTFVQSLAPVTSQDALVYHLAIPAKHVEAGRLSWVEGNFFSAFPQNVEMLFTWGLLLDGDCLAQWFHWILGVGACFATAGLARRLCPQAPRLLAAAIFGTIPTVLLIAGWAYVDLAVVLFTTLSTSLFLRWLSESGWRWLVVSSVLAGAAAGCKYTGGLQGILIAAGAAIVTLARRGTWRRALLLATVSATLVGVVACPWWIRNILETGNPLYPFCYGIFGGKDWDVERAQVLSLFLGQWGGQVDGWKLLSLPLRLTFDARFFAEESFDGMVGVAFLVGAPLVALHFWRGSMAFRVALVLALAHAFFWSQTTQQVRFLLPALAVGAALISAAVASMLQSSTFSRAPAMVLTVSCLLNVAISSLHFAHHNPLPVVLGVESRDSYLRREVPCGDYPVFEAIERLLPADAYILLGSLGNPGFLIKRRYYADALFENRTLAGILAQSAGPEQAHEALRARGFTHLLFRLENVLDGGGTRSGVPLSDQQKLMAMLNSRASLVVEKSGTYLYALTPDSPFSPTPH